MANTTIKIKSSGTYGSIPTSLEPGELAINYADGSLYYGNNTNKAVLLDISGVVSGLDKEVQFNDSGTLGASPGFTYNKATQTLTITNLDSTTISNVSIRLNSSYTHANSAYTQANTAIDNAVAMAIALG